MKKKIVALCLVLALALTAVGGATLAYFTDTEEQLNTFTAGHVNIELVENFEQNSQLVPGETVVKEATIKNIGANPAWVWAEVLIPTILDDGIVNEPTAPGLNNSLHFNYPGAYAKEYAQNKDAEGKFYNADLSKLWIHKHNADGLEYGYVGQEEVGGIMYNKYVKLYVEKLDKDAETSMFLNTVYMDEKVVHCEEEGCACEGDGLRLYGGECYNGDWEILVRAYAIQDSADYDNVVAAWKAYNGI